MLLTKLHGKYIKKLNNLTHLYKNSFIKYLRKLPKNLSWACLGQPRDDDVDCLESSWWEHFLETVLMQSTDHFCVVQIHQKVYEDNTIKICGLRIVKICQKSEIIN